MIIAGFERKLSKGVKQYLKLDITKELRSLGMYDGYASYRLGKALFTLTITDCDLVTKEELIKIYSLL